MKPIETQEAEILALMDDLEAILASSETTAEPVATAPTEQPVPEPTPEPAPWEEPAPQPEPVPEPVPAAPEPEPEPVKEPVPEPVPEPVKTPEPVTPAPAPAAIPAAVMGANPYAIDVKAFKAEIAISDSNLDEAMMSQASLRAWYGHQAAMAEAHAATLKTKFEILEARLYNEYETSLLAEGKKATANQIDAAVRRDPRWFAGRQKVIDAEAIANVNKGLTFALADRRDMLIQLGSDRRQEMQGQLRVMEAGAAAAALGQRASAATRGLKQ